MKTPYRSVFQITTAIAAGIATLLTLLAPLGYFSITYQYLIGTLDSQADISARNAASLVMANPEMWIFEQIRLAELLERRTESDTQEIRRIYNMRGEIIAESLEPLKPPILSRSHEIFDAGRPVATIEISRSIFPLILRTAGVFLLSLLLGILLFYALRQLPLNALRKAVDSLEESESSYRALYESMKEGMALYRISRTPDGTPVSFSLIEMNPACELILEKSRIELIGRDDTDLYKSLMNYFTEILQALKSGEPLSFEMTFKDQGRIFAVSVFYPDQEHFATLIEDITERKDSEEQIRKLAYYDSLTGLPNRLLMKDRLDQALARANRDNSRVAVLFLDLDRFKSVNDTLGHAHGDLLLIQVAHRLRDSLRDIDTLARLGGDEFIIILASCGEELNAAYVSQHILNNITATYTINSREVYTSASIGIAIFPDDAMDAHTLLKSADMAMYAAKESGRSGFHFYSSEMNQKAHYRMEMETSLRQAIESEQFYLEFQPIVNATDGSVVAAEALIRWDHPDKGRLMPDEFIPMAEESGLIVPLGDWVLRTACRKMKEWHDAGIPPFRLAVNISGRQFNNKGFVELVGKILTTTGANPQHLELELTETSLMANAESTIRDLFRLKELDLSIVMDDFGAGYSSLGYLKNFPIDRIKIDRSFVTDVCNNPEDRAIVEAIIAMAFRLKMFVIAEGVETAEQVAFFRSCNCDEIQGYYFHRPLTEEKLLTLLRAKTSR